MASLTSIDVPCWVCGESFSASATLTILPPSLMPGDWTYKQASANVWMYIDNAPIREHVRGHWPVIMFLYFCWKGFLDRAGFDPLEWYVSAEPTS